MPDETYNIMKAAKVIIKENPDASVKELAEKLYGAALASPKMSECKEIIEKLKAPKNQAKADGPTNSGMRWPVAFSQILTDAGIKCEGGMIAEADLDKIIELLEPHFVKADEESDFEEFMEEFDPDDTSLEELLDVAGVGADGIGVLEDYVNKCMKSFPEREDTLEGVKACLEDWESDVEQYVEPAIEQLKELIEQIEKHG